VITAQDFERMVEAHQHRIYGFALNLSGNPADAEEIAQDAFVRAHRALGGYDADRVRELKVSAWLHRIALNVFRNRVRRRMRETVPLDSVAEPHANGLGPEELHDLRSAVLGLPPRYSVMSRVSITTRSRRSSGFPRAPPSPMSIGVSRSSRRSFDEHHRAARPPG
jgi:RNA polymerase sigma factor (sigma-70 family)